MAASRTFKEVIRPGGVPAAVSTIENLTVVTYNLLADKYAMGGRHDYCPAEHLEWSSRGPRLMEELLSYKADILMLQEVERPYMENTLGPTLKSLGHEWLYFGRMRKASDPVCGPEEGVCLSYNAARLEKVASATVKFSDYIESSLSFVERGKRLKKGVSESPFLEFLADREDGAAMALLRDCQANKELLAVSSHLFWDPRHADIKSAQATLLCAAAREFLDSTHRKIHTPFILGADLNSMPSEEEESENACAPNRDFISGAYEILTQGAIAASHPHHPSTWQNPSRSAALRGLQLGAAGLQLASASAAAWGVEPPFTNRTPGFTGCLDYVMFTPGSFEVTEALEMPMRWNEEGSVDEEEMLARFPPIPNAAWPSDHLAVGAKLRWRGK